MSRYSHLGPVRSPKGVPLRRDMIVLLWQARTLLGWSEIARQCRISRSTLYRALEGGNTHPLTAESIQAFVDWWKTCDDISAAALMRRKARAA